MPTNLSLLRIYCILSGLKAMRTHSKHFKDAVGPGSVCSVSWVGLKCVIVVFSDHTHLPFVPDSYFLSF